MANANALAPQEGTCLLYMNKFQDLAKGGALVEKIIERLRNGRNGLITRGDVFLDFPKFQ
jgi:hypothetical protein